MVKKKAVQKGRRGVGNEKEKGNGIKKGELVRNRRVGLVEKRKVEDGSTRNKIK